MRRLLLPLFAATSFIAAPVTAQQPPASIAAVPQDDGYAFLEAPEDHTVGSLTAPNTLIIYCLLYTSPSPRDQRGSRMPSSA